MGEELKFVSLDRGPRKKNAKKTFALFAKMTQF